MAIGLDPPTDLKSIAGIKLASVATGSRYRDRDDLVLILLPDTADTAAVFTRNRYCAAPVSVARKHLADAIPRALVINAGSANAGTGDAGVADALETCEMAAAALGIAAETVLPFSTGVMGERLVMDLIAAGISEAAGHLAPDGWNRAAMAIMTTDTVPKAISCTVDVAGRDVTLTGMVKGSGMICPDMATMLAFVAVDARIGTPLMQQVLQTAVDASFNRITVDGDTSTNDACVLIANGRAAAMLIDDKDSEAYSELADAVTGLMVRLAQQVIRDAEGVTKFVEISVRGAATERDCREIAYTVAHSPLVKTALFASDPNWGRILAAVGRAPVERLDMSHVSLRINELQIVAAGEPVPAYTEEGGKVALAPEELSIEIALGNADTSFSLWTTDLSHDYVSINADYRS